MPDPKTDQWFNGVFDVKNTRYLFSKNSLHCMKDNNPIRKICVRVIVNTWFERFILICITANSLCLASKEYNINYDVTYESKWNKVLDYLDIFFSVVFLIECILKVIAMGFIRHKKAYLRDTWNCIDFIIVVVSVIGFTPISDESSLKVFRTMRILRPLRSMHKLESMRSLLNTFFASIPSLINVWIFLIFIISIFSIFGANFFSGTHYQFCRTTETIIIGESGDPIWPISEEARWQCSADNMCSGYPNFLKDTVIAKCGNIYRDYQLDPKIHDDSYNIEMINYDITNFNNVFSASLTIFQVMTLEGWSKLMYNYQDTVSHVTSSIFFVIVIIIGSFTTLNLVLASIMESYLFQTRIQAERNKQKKKVESKIVPANIVVLSSDDNRVDELLDVKSDSQLKGFVFNEKTNERSSNKKDHLTVIQENLEESHTTKILGNGQKFHGRSQESVTQYGSIENFRKQQPEDGFANQNENPKQILILQGVSSVPKVVHYTDRQLNHSQTVEFNDLLGSPDRLNKFSQRKRSATTLEKSIKDVDIQQIQSQMAHKKSIINSPEVFCDEFYLNQATNRSQTQVAPLNLNQAATFQEVKPNEQKIETNEYRACAQEEKLQQVVNESLSQMIEFNAEERAEKNRCYRFFYIIVISVTFNFLIYCFILANTITLAMYRFDQSEQQARILQILNYFFVWVFTAEMFAKMIGLGLKHYGRDSFNILDCIIVILSLIDFALSLSKEGAQDDSDGVMSAFRALRLLRVFKLARHWHAFQQILRTMISSLIDIANFSLLLLLVLFIFALLGMELFAFSVYEDVNGDLVFGKEKIQEAFEQGDTLTWPRQNFNNIFSALVTVFIVIVAEDWNNYMYIYVRAFGYGSEIGRNIAIAYFIVLFLIGNTILLALFTALLLKSQDEDDESIEDLIAKEKRKKDQKKLKKQSSKEVQKINQNTNCCKRINCAKRYQDFADSFVRIFGGESALNKRLKLRMQKNPQGSASPSSGNEMSVRLNKINPQNEESKQDVQNLDWSQDPFGSSPRKDKDEKSQQLQDQTDSKLFQNKKKTRLQRPHALLHYDLGQEILIKGINYARKSAKPLKGKSCYLFDPENRLRVFCNELSNSFWFEMVIILFIVASTIVLAFEHPLDDPKSFKLFIINKLDIALTGIFSIEAILKIITAGFWFNGKTSYLRDNWNILDFIIIVLAGLGMAVSAELQQFKVLRMARILRPLRLIHHLEGLKIATLAFVHAIPQIMSLQIVVSFCMFTISILMTTLLSGKLSYCQLGHTSLAMKQQDLIQNKLECLDYGGEWVKRQLNFDNALEGMISLIVFQTLEGWIQLMENSVDAAGVDLVGVRNNSPGYILLYVVLVVILCLLFANMLVRIIIQTYNMQKEFISFNSLLDPQQRSWIQVQIMTYTVKPKVQLTHKDRLGLRNFCISIAKSSYFESFIMICILLNTAVLALVWFDQPKEIPILAEILNYVFMAIFTVEAIIKIIAMRKIYFLDPWNIFDFSIVSGTLIIILLKMWNIEISFANGATILRALRIGRILRLLKRAEQLKIIFHTLLTSAPSLGSLGLLLIIIFFMFAIIGRSMFGFAQINEPMDELNEHVNFRDFDTSFLLLFRCSTGESWHKIMFDYARAYSPQYQCREDEDYASMIKHGGPKACGSTLKSYIFFIIFNLLVLQVFINLFVAIIVDAFLGQTNHFQLPIKSYSIEEFVKIWSEFDPSATGYISIKDLDMFILKLAQSKKSQELIIEYEKIVEDQNFRRIYMAMLNIPMYKQLTKVMFYDVLQQLCDKINLRNFSHDKKKYDRNVAKAMKAFGIKGIKSDMQIMLELEGDHTMDFIDTVRQMGRLDSKIALMMELQKGFIEVHEKYAVYVDTRDSIHMSHKVRKLQEVKQLRQSILIVKHEESDINILTTRHYFAGLTLLKGFQNALAKTRKRLEVSQTPKQQFVVLKSSFKEKNSHSNLKRNSQQNEKFQREVLPTVLPQSACLEQRNEDIQKLQHLSAKRGSEIVQGNSDIDMILKNDGSLSRVDRMLYPEKSMLSKGTVHTNSDQISQLVREEIARAELNRLHQQNAEDQQMKEYLKEYSD